MINDLLLSKWCSHQRLSVIQRRYLYFFTEKCRRSVSRRPQVWVNDGFALAMRLYQSFLNYQITTEFRQQKKNVAVAEISREPHKAAMM